jgi:DNA polymerase-1
LDFQSSVYTDFPKYWGLPEQSSDEGNATYGCYDCCATFIAALKQLKELDERKLLLFYRKRVHPTIFALTRMQNRGILIDTEAREAERKRQSELLQKSLIALPKLVGYDVNPNSPKQVQALLYDDWKLPIQKKPGTKRKTADEDALRALARKFPLRAPIIRTILDCRKTHKIISTYIEQELDNGRARTSYGLTKTGRISSSATIEGYGGNLQNIPRGKYRRLYIADPGKVLVKADLSQAEYRVFCWDAPVMEFIHEYTTNPDFDVHRRNASDIFRVPESEVTKERRYAAKQGVYAGNYGIGALKMSRLYDIDFHDAKTVLERYKAVRPELALWWKRIEDEIKTTRTLRNPLGRERIFFGRIDNALFRTAYDFIPQSTVADLINQALCTLDDIGVELLLQVHDELVVQCDDSPWMIKDTVRQVKEAMEIPVRFKGVEEPMIIPVEIAVGHNWYDVKEYSDETV